MHTRLAYSDCSAATHKAMTTTPLLVLSCSVPAANELHCLHTLLQHAAPTAGYTWATTTALTLSVVAHLEIDHLTVQRQQPSTLVGASVGAEMVNNKQPVVQGVWKHMSVKWVPSKQSTAHTTVPKVLHIVGYRIVEQRELLH